MSRHRPVCVQCCVEMRPEKNDVLVVDYRMPSSVETDPAKQLLHECWSADLWKCPRCNRSIVQGYGQRPLAYTEHGITEQIQLYNDMKVPIIPNYEYKG